MITPCCSTHSMIAMAQHYHSTDTVALHKKTTAGSVCGVAMVLYCNSTDTVALHNKTTAWSVCGVGNADRGGTVEAGAHAHGRGRRPQAMLECSRLSGGIPQLGVAAVHWRCLC